MSVYVDPLRDWKWKNKGKSCHLVADSDDELKAFAKRIGLNVRWLQKSPIPHFDLTAPKREAAVKLGAVEISFSEMGVKVRDARERK